MKSAKHTLSHTKKLSCNMGELLPIGIMEALPGDKINHETVALLRVQPLLAPVMHEVDVKIHHWFVPTRLIWDDFEDFITGGEDGLDNSVAPYMQAPPSTGYAIGSLADYLGLPTGVPDYRHSALPFRAYNLIWNNFYRDQDLMNEQVISEASGADTTTNRNLLFGCWEKDYFTSCRSEPQKGPDVVLPLTGNAPIVGKNMPFDNNYSGNNFVNVRNEAGDLRAINGNAVNSVIAGRSTAVGIGELIADLSDVDAANVNDLRLSTALQRLFENLMRFGSRYNERLLAAFGVKPQDSRLQLPEYLGGGQNKISFSEVLQTSETADTPLGEMAGHGIAGLKSNRYKFFAPEYGYIISLLIVRPRTNYVQGVQRLWNRNTRYDYFQPELQNLGQMEVYNREVYAGHTTPDDVFGYQDRYDDYRRIESTIAGEFRDTLDFWHMAREFSSSPALNGTFVQANPTTRIYAVPAADQLYVTAKHRIYARRRVSKIAKPMLF